MNDAHHPGKDLALPAMMNSEPTPVGNHSLNGSARSNAGELVPLLEVVLRRWRWLLTGGVLLGMAGAAAGLIFGKTTYTAPIQLIRYDSPNAEQVFGARQAAPETLPTILH